MLNNSMFYNILLIIYSWFSRQFNNSVIINKFLQRTDNIKTVENSFFNKSFNGLRDILHRVFCFLHLDKLFEGSIFKFPFIWTFLAVTLSPFLPTMAVLAIVLASFGSFLIEIICNRSKSLKYFAINKYVYIYAGIYMFATLASVTRNESLFGGMLTVCFILFFIIIINVIQTKRQMHITLFFFVCAGVLVSLYGFYQFLFPAKYAGLWHDTEMFETISFRVYSTFGNPNVLGEYFLLTIPIAFAYFLVSKKMLSKLFFLGSIGIMMLCLILTYSRGCYVGILVAMGIFLVLLDRRFILLALLALLVIPFFLPETILNRFLSIGNMEDSSTSYRVYIWLATINMLKDYWISGIGPGDAAFNKVYPAYAFNGVSAPHSHNLFLQITCDAGICGILFFIVIIFQYYKAAFSALSMSKGRNNRVFIIAGISTITGFLIQSLFDYTFYNYRIMLLFWVALGFAMIFTRVCSLKVKAEYE